MDFVLRIAREKLEKEQKERKESARRNWKKERKAKEEAKKQREVIDAERSRRPFDAALAQLKVPFPLLKCKKVYLSDGEPCFTAYSKLYVARVVEIRLSCQLPASTNCKIKVRLIRDPCTLTVHQGGSSETIDADKKKGRSTHSGVLEFTADEGFV
ncbi:hypothetical protein C1H46_044080 [Malus baccata]|uniref:Uncharacterized protein n=1 Tax=Malus baccata TaxID=106549 RepID=A0A540K828_MALBA|nr:hypothetical protein C1H46_044080 [Malus baccata]